jgi:UrcA family protein
MASALTSRILRGSLISAVAAIGLSFTTAQAQPYDDQNADAYTYANGITVYAHTYHQERAPNGAPIETVQVARVVDVSDLDLDTGYGQHIMRERVRRAATDACHALDLMPGYAPAAGESDVDCYHRAVSDALANAPVGVDTDYNGY